MKHVFISYSRREASVAREIEALLESKGFTTWIDTKNIPGGEDWQTTFTKGVFDAAAVVVLCSESAKTSEYVKVEVETAQAGGIPVLPMIVHGDAGNALPEYLAKINLVANNTESLRTRVTELVKALKQKGVPYGLSETQWRAIYWLAALLVIGMLFFGLIFSLMYPPVAVVETIPSVSIISARYLSDGYDPHLIDFRHVSDDGIPFGIERSLRMTDLWVWASETRPGYQVRADLSVNGETIGSSLPVPMQAGISEIGAIRPEAYKFEDTQDAWLVQEGWDELVLTLTILDGDTTVHEEKFPMKRNSRGLSRLQSMPLASFVTIAYSINGSQQILDMRSILPNGLEVHANDTLTLDKVWINTDSTTAVHTFKVSAYFTAGGYNPKTDRTSLQNLFSEGIHPVDGFTLFTWPVEPEYKNWVISMSRDDSALIDRLEIPLKVVP